MGVVVRKSIVFIDHYALLLRVERPLQLQGPPNILKRPASARKGLLLGLRQFLQFLEVEPEPHERLLVHDSVYIQHRKVSRPTLGLPLVRHAKRVVVKDPLLFFGVAALDGCFFLGLEELGEDGGLQLAELLQVLGRATCGLQSLAFGKDEEVGDLMLPCIKFENGGQFEAASELRYSEQFRHLVLRDSHDCTFY